MLLLDQHSSRRLLIRSPTRVDDEWMGGWMEKRELLSLGITDGGAGWGRRGSMDSYYHMYYYILCSFLVYRPGRIAQYGHRIFGILLLWNEDRYRPKRQYHRWRRGYTYQLALLLYWYCFLYLRVINGKYRRSWGRSPYLQPIVIHSLLGESTRTSTLI